MTIVTTAQRNELIALIVGMFNAAPGGNNLKQLVGLLESGMTRADIARTVSASPWFAQVYSPALTVDDFASRLVANLLGNEVDAAARQWTLGWVKSRLARGEDRAALIDTAVQALQASSNADFANARTMLLNKVDVASYYSVTKDLSSTSLAELQAVIAGVTSEPATVTTHKVLVNDISVGPPTYVYTLTAGVDTVIASAGNDTIYANTAGTLAPGDSIDAAAGNDVLHIYDYNRIDISAAVTVKNVETVNVQALAGIAGDMSAWTGLTVLNISSMAGNVTIEVPGTADVNIVAGRAGPRTVIPAITIAVSGGDAISITSDSSVFTTIANPHAGVKFVFDLTGDVAFAPPKVSLSGDATLQDYLDAAAAGAGSSAARIRWFHYQGDTYVVQDNSAGSTYVNGADATVKLIGLIDLGAATLSALAGQWVSFTLS